jgi:protein-tyrosine phosphatase
MLKDALHTEGISLKVLPGADVRLDERIPDLLTRDLVNTVADGGRYLLLELQEGIFIDVLPLVEQLSDRGVRTIITHPERNPCLINSHQQVMRWVAHGALLQLTAGSILGDFGPAVEAAARHWLGTGAAQLVATDAHGVRYRPPRLSKAADRITTSFGFAVARRTCINNPLAVVAGEEILAAPTTETSEMADA